MVKLPGVAELVKILAQLLEFGLDLLKIAPIILAICRALIRIKAGQQVCGNSHH